MAENAHPSIRIFFSIVLEHARTCCQWAAIMDEEELLVKQCLLWYSGFTLDIVNKGWKLSSASLEILEARQFFEEVLPGLLLKKPVGLFNWRSDWYLSAPFLEILHPIFGEVLTAKNLDVFVRPTGPPAWHRSSEPMSPLSLSVGSFGNFKQPWNTHGSVGFYESMSLTLCHLHRKWKPTLQRCYCCYIAAT